jgi:hypothetical protein
LDAAETDLVSRALQGVRFVQAFVGRQRWVIQSFVSDVFAGFT